MPGFGIFLKRFQSAEILSSLLLAMFLSSCATSSLFKPYPMQIADIKAQVETKQFEKSLKELDSQRDSADKTLYMLERARIAQLSGDFATSIADYRIAMQNEEQADERAKVSASDTAAKGAAMISNDNAIPYRASGYERVLMHHYQAMNYLAQKNLEAASVEIRRASLEQKQALEKYYKEIEKAEDQARKESYRPSNNQSIVDRQFQSMYAAAGNIKNSFQNAYTFYFSGVIWEMLGESNDAYIDYKKALEIFPDNHLLQKDVLRLALRLRFDDEYNLFKQKFAQEAAVPRDGEGEIVVIYEEGYVPVKEDAPLHLPIGSTLHSVALPFYRDTTHSPGNLRVSTSSKTLGNSEVIVDIRALAIKDLQEKMSGIVIRQVLRLLAKDRLQQTAKQQLGDGGAIVAMLYNAISESADRRSWLTLPRNAQVFRTRVPVGKQEFEFYSSKNFQSAKVAVDIRENQITVVHVTGTQTKLFAQLL